MIMVKILDHDLHRSKRAEAAPAMLVQPARKEFFPAVVSTTRGKFVIAPRMTKDGFANVGIFEYDADKIDNLLPEMMECAYKLSVESGWDNIFDDPKKSFNYIQRHSGLKSSPNVCLVPNWGVERITKWFGASNLSDHRIPVDPAVMDPELFSEDFQKPSVRTRLIYKDVCRIVECGVLVPTFLSKPEYVGMYTQFMGGSSAIILHNVKLGMSFCRPKGEN